MGAGKSSAARSAAEALDAPAADVDAVVEQRLGKPISSVFDEEGEGAFRAAEAEVALELLSAPDVHVVSLGGGTVMHEPVRRALAGHLVLWLDVDAETAWARVQGPDRPLARDQVTFSRLLAEREPLYAGLADVVVPAERSGEMRSVLDALEGVPDGVR